MDSLQLARSGEKVGDYFEFGGVVITQQHLVALDDHGYDEFLYAVGCEFGGDHNDATTIGRVQRAGDIALLLQAVEHDRDAGSGEAEPFGQRSRRRGLFFPEQDDFQCAPIGLVHAEHSDQFPDQIIDGSVIELQRPLELDRDPGGFACRRAHRLSHRSLETENRSAEVTDQEASGVERPIRSR